MRTFGLLPALLGILLALSGGRAAARRFGCPGGGWVEAPRVCDGVPDCPDGSDELRTLCFTALTPGEQAGPGAAAPVQAAAGPTTCPALAGRALTATCEVARGQYRERVPCDAPLPAGASARTQCRPFHGAAPGATDSASSQCRSDGVWDPPPARCALECGRTGAEVTPLIVNGWRAPYGVWPWQTALYVLQTGKWVYWCGGSLISDSVVLTAAHCVWKVVPENLRVALGKFHSDFDKRQDSTQVRDVKRIVMQPHYQDQGGNYGSDIALLQLASPVEFSQTVRPVCLDWELQYVDGHLAENSTGVILGWGVNENDTFSESLRMTSLQVLSPQNCIESQSRDFKKYVTYTSFCAGYHNATGVCNGDSGGGLVFRTPQDRWVVQGLVSVSPRRLGTSFCDPNKFTIFTKVGMYMKWLKEIMTSIEEEENKAPKTRAAFTHVDFL